MLVKDIIETFLTGNGKKYSRELFYHPYKLTELSNKYYKKTAKNYSNKYQKTYVSKEFSKIIRRLIDKKSRYFNYTDDGKYIITTDIFFLYFKYKKLPLNEKEKIIFQLLFFDDRLIKYILNKNKHDDIFNSVLKFYNKEFITCYEELLREIKENPKKYEGYYKKVFLSDDEKSRLYALKRCCRTLGVKYPEDAKEIKILKKIALVYYAKKPEIIQVAFKHYLNQISRNKTDIKTLDSKIRKALNK